MAADEITPTLMFRGEAEEAIEVYVSLFEDSSIESIERYGAQYPGPEGQVVHYLLGRFGQEYGGRQYPISQIPGSVNLIIQASHGDKTFADWFSNPEVVTYTRDWKETLRLLRPEHGAGSRVGVVPSATMAYYAG